MQIVLKHVSGETEVRDFTDRCDPESSEGEKILRDSLKELTDVISSKKSKQYRSVEIGFPIPFLKVRIVLYFFIY